MTPTEQDNELRAEVKQVLKDGFNYYIGERKDVSSDMKPLDIYCTEHLMQLITAQINQARIDELEKFVNTTNRSLSVKKLRDRLSALKAQQEEV